MLTQEQQLLSSNKYDDLAKLSLLTEDILLEHLKQRYDNDLIYVSFS
jgi:myosin heavy subunit